MGKLKPKTAKAKRKGAYRGESRTSPRRILAKQRSAQAIALRIGGATYPAIASVLGYNSPQAAAKAVGDSLAATVREPSDELRSLELERLDALFLALWPAAKRGVLGAADRCLRVMERRARLLGLDAPVSFSVDWRKEAELAGFKASDLFEELVAEIMSRAGPVGPGETPSPR